MHLLKEAVQNYNEHWLAYSLEAQGMMKEFEDARTPSGNYTIRHVPHTASETFADGQFNRFYILGLCLFCKDKGKDKLTIYRAKESQSHREKSDSLIGQSLSVHEIESQLLERKASFSSSLLQPNSGLSVKI